MAPIKPKIPPLVRSKSTVVTRSQVQHASLANPPGSGKRKAGLSPGKVTAKRSAFEDITNAAGKADQGKVLADKVASTTKKLANTKLDDKPSKKQVAQRFAPTRGNAALKDFVKIVKNTNIPKPKPSLRTKISALENVKPQTEGSTACTKEAASSGGASSLASSPEDSLYVTAVEDISTCSLGKVNISVQESAQECLPDPTPPPGVSDFDKENLNDPFQISEYAMDVFDYYKSIESKYTIKDYMNKQVHVNSMMRAIVVDWMVDVQENFELNHETLYLGVKLLDCFLSRIKVQKETLQLVAAVGIFIASKYDERGPPAVEDFLYICDGAYSRDQFMGMEIQVIKAVDFNLGFPLSYRFLRRYARCGRISMPDLTLARYILELSLMDYSFISTSESKLAAAALMLALRMKESAQWTCAMEYYTVAWAGNDESLSSYHVSASYKVDDIKDLTVRLNSMLRSVPSSLKTVKNKYSHRLFFEVAKLPLLDDIVW